MIEKGSKASWNISLDKVNFAIDLENIYLLVGIDIQRKSGLTIVMQFCSACLHIKKNFSYYVIIYWFMIG